MRPMCQLTEYQNTNMGSNTEQCGKNKPIWAE